MNEPYECPNCAFTSDHGGLCQVCGTPKVNREKVNKRPNNDELAKKMSLYAFPFKNDYDEDLAEINFVGHPVMDLINSEISKAVVKELESLHDWAFEMYEPNSRGSMIILEIDDRINEIKKEGL